MAIAVIAVLVAFRIFRPGDGVPVFIPLRATCRPVAAARLGIGGIVVASARVMLARLLVEYLLGPLKPQRATGRQAFAMACCQERRQQQNAQPAELCEFHRTFRSWAIFRL